MATSMCLDFAITNPLRLDRYKNSSVVQCAAASDYAKTEKAKPEYLALCRQHDFSYVPVVVETYGAILPSAIAVLDDLALVHSRNNHLPFNRSSHYLYTSISFALLSEICFSILYSSTPLANYYPFSDIDRSKKLNY